MSDASPAECAAYDARDAGVERKDRKMSLRLKTVPWVRVIVDTLLIAGILLASSSFLSLR
jgi:hypothetical protein